MTLRGIRIRLTAVNLAWGLFHVGLALGGYLPFLFHARGIDYVFLGVLSLFFLISQVRLYNGRSVHFIIDILPQLGMILMENLILLANYNLDFTQAAARVQFSHALLGSIITTYAAINFMAWLKFLSYISGVEEYEEYMDGIEWNEKTH
jgi:hypothetical protein